MFLMDFNWLYNFLWLSGAFLLMDNFCDDLFWDLSGFNKFVCLSGTFLQLLFPSLYRLLVFLFNFNLGVSNLSGIFILLFSLLNWVLDARLNIIITLSTSPNFNDLLSCSCRRYINSHGGIRAGQISDRDWFI